MRNKRIWELLCPKQKAKLIALTIILILGTWGWTTFSFIFPPMYQESQKVWSEHLNRLNTPQETEESKTKTDEKVQAFSIETGSENGEEDSISPLPLGNIEKLIYEKFGQENYKVARAVAFAESHLNPQAIGHNRNGTTDCGVFQINSIHGLDDCQNPEKNIEYAKELFDRSGWTPWTVYKTGAYQKYLALN